MRPAGTVEPPKEGPSSSRSWSPLDTYSGKPGDGGAKGTSRGCPKRRCRRRRRRRRRCCCCCCRRCRARCPPRCAKPRQVRRRGVCPKRRRRRRRHRRRRHHRCQGGRRCRSPRRRARRRAPQRHPRFRTPRPSRGRCCCCCCRRCCRCYRCAAHRKAAKAAGGALHAGAVWSAAQTTSRRRARARARAAGGRGEGRSEGLVAADAMETATGEPDDSTAEVRETSAAETGAFEERSELRPPRAEDRVECGGGGRAARRRRRRRRPPRRAPPRPWRHCFPKPRRCWRGRRAPRWIVRQRQQTLRATESAQRRASGAARRRPRQPPLHEKFVAVGGP